MVTAEITISKEKLLDIKNPIQYFGLDWNIYEEISEELGESRRLPITFNKGTLTIMPITELHEMLVALLERLIGVVSLVTQKDIVPTGQATLRLKSRDLAAEPDLSYFVRNAVNHKIKTSVPNEMDSPPDIVVEIDFYHLSDDKFEIYREFGVPEYWQYQNEKLKMFKLQDGEYTEIDRSEQIPILTSAVLTEFLNRGQNEGQFKILSDFHDWLQENK